MRVMTVVGIRGSGKTTIVEKLIEGFQEKGCRVGTVKSIFCPGFRMDRDQKNTGRHAKAGASIVTARAGKETAVLFQEPLKTSELLRHYEGCDWVICEGDYEIPAPRIVAGREEQDALERINPLTVAVSGVLANQRQEALEGIPVIHPLNQTEELIGLLLEEVREVEDLTLLDQPLNGEDIALSRSWCLTGCRGHGREKA